MIINLQFTPPIPDGMRIMEADMEVGGIQYHKENVLAFARRKQQRLELQREPKNLHDPDAIKVIGVSKGWFFWRRDFLGYVPQKTAKRVAAAGKWSVIMPRLKNVWIGGHAKDVMYIKFDILEPKVQ